MDDKSWGPGYASALLQGLDTLRRRGLTTDVVLLAGGRQFPAHRAVLASCSGYFYSAFVEGRCGDPQLVSLPGVTCEAMAALLDFMYAGELPARAAAATGALRELAAAARSLRVHGVAQACQRLVKESLLDAADLKPSKEEHGANPYSQHLQQLFYSLHNAAPQSSPSSSTSSPPSSVYSPLGDAYQFSAFSPFFHRTALAAGGYKLSPFCYAGPRGAEPLWWPLAARGACSQHQQQQREPHAVVKSEIADDSDAARSPAGSAGDADPQRRVIDMSAGAERQRRRREDEEEEDGALAKAAETPPPPPRRAAGGPEAADGTDREPAPRGYWKKHKLRSCMALISRQERLDGEAASPANGAEAPPAAAGNERRCGGEETEVQEVVGAEGSSRGSSPRLVPCEEYKAAVAAQAAQAAQGAREEPWKAAGARGEQRVYRCDTCDAEFRHKGNLTSHRAVHTGEKPYPCEVCGARFNRPANLKTHARIHSGEKPYRCDSCGARFVQVAHLRAHVLIHTGEKPYPCAVCGTRFRHLQTLKSHVRIHTGEKPYHCETCDVHFRHKSQLRLHLRQKHGAVTNTKTRYGPAAPPCSSSPPA